MNRIEASVPMLYPMVMLCPQMFVALGYRFIHKEHISYANVL